LDKHLLNDGSLNQKKSGKNSGANTSRVVSSHSINKGKKEYRNGTFIDESPKEYIKQMIINKTKGESNINDQNDTIDVKIDSDDQ